ncbi:helix-turn-helix domain-containing protein [Amycolatopsis panacis]|uniref:XRE family transcriptional regulator n=1 Tax=Amycolatopsis panacis TaxID=2340917 RepID=A0A419HL36_9PSEU|nr:helix-turn-helix transcriptional regulator [Amycolatopsis panacis]RJQ76604.1 XRE family transcriptional regulator [Amycolatopsis panacis]
MSRAHREAAGQSQEDPACEARWHWTFVSQVERGLRNVNLLKLADRLRIDR